MQQPFHTALPTKLQLTVAFSLLQSIAAFFFVPFIPRDARYQPSAGVRVTLEYCVEMAAGIIKLPRRGIPSF